MNWFRYTYLMAHNRTMKAAIEAYQAEMRTNPRYRMTRAEVRAQNRKAAEPATPRQAAAMASKARRGI